MADAVVTMGARWDGKNLKKGVDDAKRQVNTLKKTIGEFSSFVKGAAGIGGLTLAMNHYRNALRDIAEEQKVNASLNQTLAGTGANLAEATKRIADEMIRLRRNSMFGDTDLARGLQNLLIITQDYEGSLKNLQLAVDLAAARNIDLMQSTKLVGFAMKGVVEPLNEVSVKVRLWAQANRELLGTKEGTEAVLNILSRDTVGQAAAQMDSLAGSMKSWAEGWRELRDAMAEIALLDSVRPGNNLDRTAEDIRNADGYVTPFGFLPSRRRWREMKQEARDAWNEFWGDQPGRGTAGAPYPRPPKGWKPPVAEQPPFGPYGYEGAIFGPDSGDFFKEALEEQARLEREAADEAERRAEAYRSIMEDAKERAATLKEFADRRKSKAAEEAQARAAEAENKRLQHVSELQSAFAGAFMSIRSGWEGLVDYMRDYLMQRLAWFIAGRLANSIFPGLGLAVGAAGGGGGGGTPDTLPGYPPSTAIGASRAVMQQNAWRMQRSLR